jgi:hypothetical protein
MGGGGSPAAPSPVAVPSAADQEASEERARLYSLLRSRRGGRGLAFGPAKRFSLLSLTQPKKKTAPSRVSALAEVGSGNFGGDQGGSGLGDSSATEGAGGGFGSGDRGTSTGEGGP